MYTLHKLLKGGRKERAKSSEFSHTERKWRHCKHPCKHQNWYCLGGGFCVTVGGSGKDKRASVSVFRQKNVQLGTNWDNCWPINILFTMKQIQSCKIQEPSTFQYVDSKTLLFWLFIHFSIYDFHWALLTTEITLLLSEREQMHLSQPLSDKTICTVCSLLVLKPTDFNDNITAA